jgi:hypothetical protein
MLGRRAARSARGLRRVVDGVCGEAEADPGSSEVGRRFLVRPRLGKKPGFGATTPGWHDRGWSVAKSRRHRPSPFGPWPFDGLSPCWEEIAGNTTCWYCFCTEHSLGTFLHKTPGFVVNYCAKH